MKKFNSAYYLVLAFATIVLALSEYNLYLHPVDEIVQNAQASASISLSPKSPCYKYTIEANSNKLDFIFTDCYARALDAPNSGEKIAHVFCREEMKKYEDTLNKDLANCVLGDIP